MSLTKAQANALIAEKIAEAQRNVDEATKLADEHGLTFDMNLTNHWRGELTYYGKTSDGWNESACYEVDKGVGWRSSSDDC